MSTTPSIFTVVTTKLNAGQTAGNAGAGSQNADGSFNTSGVVLGTAQTVHAGIEMATLGKSVGNALPATGFGLSVISGWQAATKISDAYSSGQSIQQSDIASLVKADKTVRTRR